MASEAEIGVAWPQAKESLEPSEAVRGEEQPQPSRGAAKTLISDFWPPGLRKNKSLGFWGFFWYVCLFLS